MLLCIDSAGDWLTLALQKGTTLLAKHASLQRHSHARAVLPLAQAMLQAHRLELSEVDCFGACIGPGSFTGLRVGIVTVKSLAFAKQTPCVGIPSTEILAASVDHDGPLGCAIDAKKGEAYFALYDQGGEGRNLLVEPFSEKPQAGLQRLLGEVDGNLLLVGSACEAYGDQLKEVGSDRIIFAPPHTAVPCPATLSRLCLKAYEDGLGVSPGVLEPMYVRPPSITTKKRP